MVNPRASTAVVCNTCNKTIGRRADLARHMRVHATNKEALMHACPHPECTYKTLQRSNLATHMNVHSRERPNKCPEDGCDFSTSDPGSLTRHRKESHGYEPKANSGSHPSTIARKAARQQRRISPYTPSSSISPICSVRSVSLPDPPSGIYSPRPRVSAILDLSPPSSPLPANAHEKDGIKNTSAAYSTELITKLLRVNDSGPAPNRKPENSLLLTPGLSTALDAPTVDYTQLPVPEQGNLCAVDLPAHPVSAGTTPIEVSDAMLDEFLAQFDNWYPKATPAYTPPCLPAPFGQYPVNNVHAPTPASLPSYGVQYTAENVTVPTPAPHPSYGAQYAVDNAIMFTPALSSYGPQYTAESVTVPTPASHPSYGAQYAVDNATMFTPAPLSSYGPQYTAENVTVPTPASHPSYRAQYTLNNAAYSYHTDAVSFDAQFPQLHPFTAPDMGFYPHVFDQTYFYTAPAATTGFPMQVY